MFDLSLDKLLVIAVVAIVIVGPAKLPQYAAKLAAIVRKLRELLSTAKDRVREEVGEEFDSIDWKKLDPKSYDPRAIVRAALEDSPATVSAPARSPDITVDRKASNSTTPPGSS